MSRQRRVSLARVTVSSSSSDVGRSTPKIQSCRQGPQILLHGRVDVAVVAVVVAVPAGVLSSASVHELSAA